MPRRPGAPVRAAVFSSEVARSISTFGIHPERTALQSPWQNGTAERFVGTVRRELLDHMVVLSEGHLRRLLRKYVDCYNRERRPHLDRRRSRRPCCPRTALRASHEKTAASQRVAVDQNRLSSRAGPADPSAGHTPPGGCGSSPR
ncbi:MAG: transposase [Deltaproteobacteria bacterium]|nr:MAG: transposase [Deltaproteobacteria bacterium]